VAEKSNLHKQFLLSLILLVCLVVSSAATGSLLAVGQWGVAAPVGLVTLGIFAVVAHAVGYQPGRTLFQREQELAQLVKTDELTGLQTRQHILERLSAELNRAMRSGESLSCALVRIDGFREINEKFGQAAGDSVLRSVGSLIAESCRQYDAAGRSGGEEFLIVLPTTEIDDAGRVADRLRRRVAERQFACHGEGFAVTTSIGVTQADVYAADTVDVLVSRANKALERARAEGGNRVSALTTQAFVERTVTQTPTPIPR